MKKKIKKPKLMCPIRDFASLEACAPYADEVYFSVSDLSLRQNSNNLTLRELPKFVKKCRENGIESFLAVNSVIYNDDIKTAEKIIKAAKKDGVGAVIVWDLAAIEIARKEKMPFVISTQANVSNWKAAEFFKNLGARRVVLAREMTLKQIKAVARKVCGIEIETFVHGAMCFSISGRCLLSAAIYNKSANCGSCAQPCRKEWTLTDDEGHRIVNEGKYFMSARDLCMVEYIPELIEAGIDSFKIEGRRRDPNYIETTARVYRQAIDYFYNNLPLWKRGIEGDLMISDYEKKAQKWKKELATVYNRGFSTGFYFGSPKKEGISFDVADNQSPYKKVLVGTVAHFYPKPQVALIRLSHKGIKKGDELYFEGPKTYLRQKADSLEIENKQVKGAKKGEDVGMKVEKPIERGANVFVYEKDT